MERVVISTKVKCGKETEVLIEVASTLKEERMPVDICILVDKSGSMSGSPFRLVQDTIDFFLTMLKPRDRLSVISFDDGHFVNVPLTFMKIHAKRSASISVERMKTSRCTNIGAALREGIEQLKSPKQIIDTRSRNRCIFLFTDGCPNCGITSTEGLLSLIPSDRDWILYCFGYTNAVSSQMLYELSNVGGGEYYFMQNENDIQTKFALALGGLLSCNLRNVMIGLTITEDYSLESITSGYCVDGDCGGDSREILIPYLSIGERKSVLVRLRKGTENQKMKKNVMKIDLLYEHYDDEESQMSLERRQFDVQEESHADCDEGTLSYFKFQECRIQCLTLLQEFIDEKRVNLMKSKNLLNSFKKEKMVSNKNEMLEMLIRILELICTKKEYQVLPAIYSFFHMLYKETSNCTLYYQDKTMLGAYTTERRVGMVRKMKSRHLSPYCFNCGSKSHFCRFCVEDTICHNCKSPNHISTNCPIGKKCHQCGSTSHEVSKCPDLKCFRCGDFGHRSEDCKQKKDVCYNCKGSGHKSFECPQKENKFGGGRSTGRRKNGKCFLCGKVGHKKYQCPNNRKKC